MTIRNRVVPALLSAVVFAAGPVVAAPTAAVSIEEVNEINGRHNGGIAPSNTDLLQTVGSITSSMGATFDSDVSGQIVAGSLTTGTIGAGVEEENTNNPNDTNAVFAAGSGEWIEYALDTTLNPLGYDIESISTYTYWTDLRSRQAYTVQVRQVGGSFVDLFTLTPPTGSSGEVVKIEITDGDTDVLASGIDAVRFNFADVGPDWAAYREIDVVGIETVPEPSTIALLGLGIACVGYRRRRDQ